MHERWVRLEQSDENQWEWHITHRWRGFSVVAMGEGGQCGLKRRNDGEAIEQQGPVGGATAELGSAGAGISEARYAARLCMLAI